MKPTLRIEKPECLRCREKRQARISALAEKRAKGLLTLEDIFEQQQIIIEMLNELLEHDESY